MAITLIRFTFEITDFNMYDKDRKTQVVEKDSS
jgi:hypothetical protein